MKKSEQSSGDVGEVQRSGRVDEGFVFLAEQSRSSSSLAIAGAKEGKSHNAPKGLLPCSPVFSAHGPL